MEPTRSTERINRRKYLTALAAAGGASVAGCLGDDDGDGGDDGDGAGDDGAGGDDGDDGTGDDGTGDDGTGGGELGERVPEITYEFSTGLGNWSQIEQTVAEIASANMEDALGLTIEPQATEAFTYWDHMIYDTREANLYSGGFAPNPSGLDPQFFLGLYHIQYAGNQDGLNQPHYHNCEYSQLVQDQFFATSLDEREEIVHQAMEVFSEDIPEINTFPVVGYTAANTNQVVIDPELQGDAGPSYVNQDWVTQVETPGGDTLRMSTDPRILNTPVHPMIDAPIDLMLWSTTIYSPLMAWDRNQEVRTNLAEDFEISEDGSTFTFYLRDATFHDGTQVTAEDMKYTLHLHDNEYTPGGSDVGYESITAVDDQTLEVAFPTARPTFMSGGAVTSQGVVPKHIWDEKLNDDFSNLPEVQFSSDEIVGSGPYELVEWQQDTLLHLTPNGDHWATPNQDLMFIAHADTQSAARAFEQGEIAIFAPSGSLVTELEQNDWVWASRDVAFSIGCISPQMSFPPSMFREFRLACSQAINRREANQAAAYGDSEPHLHSAPLAPDHPWYPEDHEGLTQITPSAEGDPELARQTLEDAGWGWDDDGNLHYPPDYDLTPVWPVEESPMDYPEEFPCVEEIPEEYPG